MSQNELSRYDMDRRRPDRDARRLEAGSGRGRTGAGQGLTFVTPIAATYVPYDLERQLHEFHAPARPLIEEETARVQELSSENDALIAQLKQELSEGSAEAETAEARIEAIERELETIEDAGTTSIRR
jgi:ParB family chromosome partitioning protein